MRISKIIKKMIEYYKGNIHDINHFMKVYTFAKTIGECENLDKETMEVIETAAAVHDISCPLCREKYGNTNGRYQEIESPVLLEEFFKGMEYSQKFIQRIIYLVSHHHTLTDITEIDYQILIEADYLVNAGEKNLSKENITNMRDRIFKTKTGILLLNSVYALE